MSLSSFYGAAFKLDAPCKIPVPSLCTGVQERLREVGKSYLSSSPSGRYARLRGHLGLLLCTRVGARTVFRRRCGPRAVPYITHWMLIRWASYLFGTADARHQPSLLCLAVQRWTRTPRTSRGGGVRVRSVGDLHSRPTSIRGTRQQLVYSSMARHTARILVRATSTWSLRKHVRWSSVRFRTFGFCVEANRQLESRRADASPMSNYTLH
ncbi:hypothetical protein EXIGLDRAFT_517858 [Exidia glandulosa HHB12029]|uniref:Uncharacterized protein n=1 Tax=Exidia glandulosa HHB12029 TaxID=1314781 RepID=A0A166N2C6_EXIGL|nr:hypothetical protein EXIGLDRAFT_517858 [Exidia glandulosa HHB12029]